MLCAPVRPLGIHTGNLINHFPAAPCPHAHLLTKAAAKWVSNQEHRHTLVESHSKSLFINWLLNGRGFRCDILKLQARAHKNKAAGSDQVRIKQNLMKPISSRNTTIKKSFRRSQSTAVPIVLSPANGIQVSLPFHFQKTHRNLKSLSRDNSLVGVARGLP